MTAPVVLVALLLTLVMLLENRSTVDELTSESVQQVHLRIAQRLTTLMASTERVGLVVAGLVETGYLDPDDLPAWKDHLLTQSVALPELSGVTWGDSQGRTVWIARFPGEDQLQLCLKTRPQAQARRFRLQPDGQLDDQPVAVYDYDPRQRPWYQKAVEKDAPIWLEPYIWTSRSGAEPVVAVAIARPVHDPGGKLLGVVNCTFTLPHLSDFLATLKVGHGGLALILDQSGQVIASGQPPDAPLLQAALAQRPVDEFSWQGNRYRLATSEFHYPEGLKQTVVTVVPEAELAAGAYRARLKALWVTVGAVLVSLLVGLRLASTIVEPISGLVDQVHQLEKSRTPTAVPPLLAARSDELGRLSQALLSLSQAVHEAEETLRQRERYYRSLIENSSDITLVLDAKNRVSYVSPAIERLGVAAEWLRGEALPERVNSEDAESLRATLARARENPDQIFTLDFSLGERVLQAVVSGGPESELVLNSRDVTERRRLSQLEHEKTALEATARARTGFLAHVTHELRTPMNSILGFTAMLLRRLGELPERDRDALETIDRNAKHLLKLIEGILELGKLEAGGTELSREVFSVKAVVEDVYRAVQPLAAQSGAVCELECDEVGQLDSDLTKVRQILFNLLSNACKFAPDGRIKLRVWEDQGQLLFVVSDTGIGMTSEQLKKVFEPFTQADATIARRFGGTGLGLTLTRSFCELLGGTLAVESEFGVGTTFTVCLPKGPLEASRSNSL